MKKTRSLGTVEDIYGGVLRFKYPESGWKDLFITSKCLGLKFHDCLLYTSGAADEL